MLGMGFFGLAIWRAICVRRDLARGETRWETSLFGRRHPIIFHVTPVRFWCAIAVHSVIAILFALVAAAAFRASAFARL